MPTVLVTGGAGFIGSGFIRMLIRETDYCVVNVDKLTYAGNLDSLAAVSENSRYSFERADICDTAAIRCIFDRYQPESVVHLAAESHVDRSIDGPGDFIQTNVVGTFSLLQAALRHWRGLDTDAQRSFRFVHISTDEVFGSLGDTGYFTEDTPYSPNSPYAATKAGSDHLVRAWFHTYGLPTITTNCSNNYGPYQFPEKLIPLVIQNALAGKPVPVYGRGENVRDWLYVDDHARALRVTLERGEPGQTYNVGGASERRNIDVVEALCDAIDDLAPVSVNRRDLITFVADRPGHDKRYGIEARKIRGELGWEPRETFESGLRKTVRWYIDNQTWVARVQSRAYRGEHLGLGALT